MSNKKSRFSFQGKGYYIALILCAAAIGISGYLYYHNTKTPDDSLQAPVSNTDPGTNGDAQVAVTDPGLLSTEPTDPQTTQVPAKPGKITRPVSGETVMDYAMEVLSYNPTTRDWRVHNGIDIAAEAGTEVVAAADGMVYTVYEDETMGHTVVIRHDNGYVTKYSSLGENISVTAGQKVASGQVIGSVSCSALLETAIGDHLHFSVTVDGEAVDPEEFLAGE